MTGIAVLAASAIDPGQNRITLSLPPGMTLAEIVEAALPGASPAVRARARVALVNAQGSMLIPAERWHSIRPRAGVQVVIRLVPGKEALGAILSIIVSIAAFALGSIFGGPLAGLLGVSEAVGKAIVGLGVTLLGQLLISALIPPAKPEEQRNSYSISGWRNRMDLDGAVPVVLGQVRYAPPFAARSYTEIVGDWQYLHALFNFGEGPVELSDFRIGDTSIADYDEIDLEVRQGLPDDPPCSIYPTQILEESIGVELIKPFPRDDLGEIISGSTAEETPVVRTTGGDASGASVIIAFPTGLLYFNSKGKKRQMRVSVRIEQRLVQAEEWQPVTTLTIAAVKTEAFYRQHSWTFPSRGRWQVRMTMLTDETTDNKVIQRTVWAGLQTIRPEYPLNYHRPLALVAVRVKATHQLSGTLDNFSAVVRRVCLDWDAATETWISRATSNPASLYRYVLQCPANPTPAADNEIDLELLQGWHEWCASKALHYNRVLDQAGMTLREALSEVAGAGRATPRHDGLRWGVVIDRPSDLVVDHVNPRNSWAFSVTRPYVRKPHAWIVEFQDEGNDYKMAKRIIRRPGYEGDITLTETLELPGITDPDTIYREGLRRFYEAEYRADTFEATQDGAVRVATRGDTVMFNSDVVSLTQWAGRVRSVAGSGVTLDSLVTMVGGQTYAIRFRVFADAEDTIGTSAVRIVVTQPGETEFLTVTGSGPMPLAGEIVHFGLHGSESRALVITGIETTQDQCSILRAVAAAPEIDALVDAAEVPEWSARVGAEIDPALLAPSAPRFASVTSGREGTEYPDQIDVLLAPGPGLIGVAAYELEHKLAADSDWEVLVVSAAEGGAAITAYDLGDTVHLRVRGISHAGTPGPYSATVTVTIGADDAPIPAALVGDAITVTTLLGGALIQAATGADEATVQVQVYRSTSAVLDRETDAVGAPYAVSPMQSYSFALGDTTRTNLASGGAMNTPGDWTLTGAGWTISGGVATHAAGAVGAIGHVIPITSGKWYRLGFTVSGRSAGTLQPRLLGGTTRNGTLVSANGTRRDRIQAVTGNVQVNFYADSAFNGSLDNVVAYLETTACLAPGTHYIWLEPQNADGVPGPLSGPFTIDII